MTGGFDKLLTDKSQLYSIYITIYKYI